MRISLFLFLFLFWIAIALQPAFSQVVPKVLNTSLSVDSALKIVHRGLSSNDPNLINILNARIKHSKDSVETINLQLEATLVAYRDQLGTRYEYLKKLNQLLATRKPHKLPDMDILDIIQVVSDSNRVWLTDNLFLSTQLDIYIDPYSFEITAHHETNSAASRNFALISRLNTYLQSATDPHNREADVMFLLDSLIKTAQSNFVKIYAEIYKAKYYYARNDTAKLNSQLQIIDKDITSYPTSLVVKFYTYLNDYILPAKDPSAVSLKLKYLDVFDEKVTEYMIQHLNHNRSQPIQLPEVNPKFYETKILMYLLLALITASLIASLYLYTSRKQLQRINTELILELHDDLDYLEHQIPEVLNKLSKPKVD